MHNFFILLGKPLSLGYLGFLFLYFLWVLKTIGRKRRQLDQIALALREMGSLDPETLVNSSKESILAQLPTKNRVVKNRVELIVNYAQAGIPYTQDVLINSEEEAFDIDDIVGDLNIFPLLGLAGTTGGLIFALGDLPDAKNMELVTFMNSLVPNMTLAFSSTLYAIVFLVAAHFLGYSSLRGYREHLIGELDGLALAWHMALLRSKDIYKISEKFYESVDKLEAAIRYVDQAGKSLNAMTTSLEKFGQSFDSGAKGFMDNQKIIGNQISAVDQSVRSFADALQSIVDGGIKRIEESAATSQMNISQQLENAGDLLGQIRGDLEGNANGQRKVLEGIGHAMETLRGSIKEIAAAEELSRTATAELLEQLKGQFDGLSEHEKEHLTRIAEESKRLAEVLDGTKNVFARLEELLKSSRQRTSESPPKTSAGDKIQHDPLATSDREGSWFKRLFR